MLSCRRQIVEIRMKHCLVGRESSLGIADEQFLKKIPSLRVQFGHHLREAGRWMVNRERFVLRQLTHVGPRIFGGSAEKFEDSLQLVVHIRSGKQRPTGIRQLCELKTNTG